MLGWPRHELIRAVVGVSDPRGGGVKAWLCAH